MRFVQPLFVKGSFQFSTKNFKCLSEDGAMLHTAKKKERKKRKKTG